MDAILLCFSLGLLVGIGVQGCSMVANWKPPTIQEQTFYPDTILYGRVQSKVNTTIIEANGDGFYNVEMDVFCSLKGPQLPAVITVTKVGYMCCICTSTNLTVGMEYIVMMSKDNEGAYVIQDQLSATNTNMLEVRKACGLERHFPGSGMNGTLACPEPWDEGACISKAPQGILESLVLITFSAVIAVML